MGKLADSLSTLPLFAAYFAGACGLTAVFVLLYANLTPHREIALIRSGNNAAAVALIGGLFGFVMPLASVIAHSARLFDVLVWGVVALIVQLGGFMIARALLPGLPAAIESGQMSDAIFLAGLSVSLGVLDAACMAG